MRILSGVTDQYIYFVAVDATDLKTRETGLTGFTVYRSRNGAAAAAMTTPTINETDSTNMPGVYELLLDEDMTIGTGNDSEEMVFHITHASMAPVTRVIELYRPKITAGYTLGVGSDGDLLEVNTLTGHTAQTGDNYARLGAPAGASIAADLLTIDNLVDDLESRLTAARAGYLDELAAANIPADIDSLLSRLSAARAGYLDELGAVNLPADIDAILADTNELQTDWVDGGRLDNLLDGAASAGDPWTTSIPGAYGAGTAGNILGNLNDVSAAEVKAAIEAAGSHLALILEDTGTTLPATLTTIAGYLDTEIAAILEDTGTTIPGLIAALNDITAAEVKTAIEAAGSHLALILADTNELQTDDIPALIAGLNDLSAADVNAEVVDALATDTYAEPSSVPSATSSLKDKIGFLFALARNKVTQTSSTQTLRNDADSANIGTSTVSDDGTTATRGEYT